MSDKDWMGETQFAEVKSRFGSFLDPKTMPEGYDPDLLGRYTKAIIDSKNARIEALILRVMKELDMTAEELAKDHSLTYFSMEQDPVLRNNRTGKIYEMPAPVGRPPVHKSGGTRVNIYLPNDVNDWLKARASPSSQIITELVREAMKRTPQD